MLLSLLEAQGPSELADRLGVRLHLATEQRKSFFEGLLPGLSAVLEAEWQDADGRGFAEALTGRRLYLPRSQKGAAVRFLHDAQGFWGESAWRPFNVLFGIPVE